MEKVTKEEMARRLVRLFPDKQAVLTEHYEEYGELLGHIFFAEEVNVLLVELLTENAFPEKVACYCGFIEEMWRNGDAAVVNIVDVTILERLSDDETVWRRFGQHISEDFKEYINRELLKKNCMMWGITPL